MSLDGAFRYLVAATGEPVAVTLRAAGGRSAPAVWDGAAGFLAVPDLAGLLPAADDGGRLSLDVEATDAPVFRVALVGPASGEAAVNGAGRGQEQTAREIGGVRVRFDPGDAGVVGAFARGAHAPLPTWRLNRWAHSIALTPGFDELVSLPFLRDVVPYEHQLAAVEELFNLVTLLQPGQLKTLRAFRREHLARGDRRQPRDPEGLRRLLADVMVRNRRATTSVGLVRRIARTVAVEPTGAERDLYAGLSDHLRERCRPGGGVTRMMAQTIQMELGSSVAAALGSLDRMLLDSRWEPAVGARLRQLRDRAAAVEGDAKRAALLSLLGTWPDKLLVFTRFRATQAHLAGVLGAAGLAVALYHGGLRRQEKEDAVRAFEGPCRVLVSTEAGGEGRNLQFAHGLVNYDLPWNPMRIEQRIGRLSRVGQMRDVHVFNLVAPGTIEEAILEVLDAKINMFELVIGEIDMILGQLSTDQDFEELVTDLWLGAEGPGAFRDGMQALSLKLLDAKRAYLSIKALDDRLFGDALAPAAAG